MKEGYKKFQFKNENFLKKLVKKIEKKKASLTQERLGGNSSQIGIMPILEASDLNAMRKGISK